MSSNIESPEAPLNVVQSGGGCEHLQLSIFASAPMEFVPAVRDLPGEDTTFVAGLPTLILEETNRVRSAENWYINQFADNRLGRGLFACAPTSLLMAMSYLGVADANENLRQDLIRETGTTPVSGLPGDASILARVARNRGLNAEYNPSRSVNQIDAALESGKVVVANGKTTSGVKHFVFVAGKNEQGNYIIGDPSASSSRPTVWTRQELQSFMNRISAPTGFAAIWTNEQGQH